MAIFRNKMQQYARWFLGIWILLFATNAFSACCTGSEVCEHQGVACKHFGGMSAHHEKSKKADNPFRLQAGAGLDNQQLSPLKATHPFCDAAFNQINSASVNEFPAIHAGNQPLLYITSTSIVSPTPGFIYSANNVVDKPARHVQDTYLKTQRLRI